MEMRKLLFTCILVLSLMLMAGPAMAIAVVDDGGPDDYGGQKDLNKLEVNNYPTYIDMKWNWDDTHGVERTRVMRAACSIPIPMEKLITPYACLWVV